MCQVVELLRVVDRARVHQLAILASPLANLLDVQIGFGLFPFEIADQGGRCDDRVRGYLSRCLGFQKLTCLIEVLTLISEMIELGIHALEIE